MSIQYSPTLKDQNDLVSALNCLGRINTLKHDKECILAGSSSSGLEFIAGVYKAQVGDIIRKLSKGEIRCGEAWVKKGDLDGRLSAAIEAQKEYDKTIRGRVSKLCSGDKITATKKRHMALSKPFKRALDAKAAVESQQALRHEAALSATRAAVIANNSTDAGLL